MIHTNRDWQVQQLNPIRKHPLEEIHFTAGENYIQLRGDACGNKTCCNPTGCDSSTLSKIEPICVPFKGGDRICWEKQIEEMEPNIIVVE